MSTINTPNPVKSIPPITTPCNNKPGVGTFINCAKIQDRPSCQSASECAWSQLSADAYYDIRKNKTILFSKMHSFSGPYFRFIIFQICAIFIKYSILKVILVKYPIKSFLFLKFFIYMFIINVTVFYINNLIKEFNVFNLRNKVYGNTSVCLVADRNAYDLSKYYGDDISENSSKCINLIIPKSTHWRDLYLYSDYEFMDDNDDVYDNKMKSINNIGAIITVYSIFYFLIIFICEFFAFYKDIHILKYVSAFLMIFIISIYYFLYDNINMIQSIQKYKYKDDNKLATIDFFNDYDNFELIKDQYFIKESLNIILIVTILYTIIFSTNKFYD